MYVLTDMTPTPEASRDDLEALRSLGTGLLSLVHLAHTAHPEHFLQQAVHELRTLVGFDAAWWGELSRGEAGQPPRNWTHGSISLAASFAEEWNRIASVDRFARSSISQLGVVVRFAEDRDSPPADPEVAAFCHRHRLFHGMAVTLELPLSGLFFFISIYRSRPGPAFTEQEGIVLGSFARHLVQHWRHRLDALQGQGPPGQAGEAYALADSRGRLLYLGRRVGLLLDDEHPGWPGTMLPGDLAHTAAGPRRVLALGRAGRLVVERQGPLIALLLHARQPGAGLPPRELSVATLYAQGHSSKGIAALLGLSPATVRTYLSSAYRQLGVQNKFELMHALRSAHPLAAQKV